MSNATNIALALIQQHLVVPKNQYNSFGKYHYRSCEDIMEAVKPLLAEYSATLTVRDDLELIGERYYVKATATLCSTEADATPVSATAYARECLDKKGMDDSQVTGATSSYARKYALNGLFCIDDTKDADASKPTRGRKPASAKTDSKSATENVTKDPELVAAQQEILNYCRDQVKKGKAKNELLKIISDNNNGHKDPSRISSVEKCHEILELLKNVK